MNDEPVARKTSSRNDTQEDGRRKGKCSRVTRHKNFAFPLPFHDSQCGSCSEPQVFLMGNRCHTKSNQKYRDELKGAPLGCEEFLSGLAWLLLSKTGPPSTPSLYIYKAYNILMQKDSTELVPFPLQLVSPLRSEL